MSWLLGHVILPRLSSKLGATDGRGEGAYVSVLAVTRLAGLNMSAVRSVVVTAIAGCVDGDVRLNGG